MPKFNLTQQLASQRYNADSGGDFDGLLEVSDRRAGQSLVMLPLAKLVEYKDRDFERISGRPQPFRTYSQEELESLAQSIAEHGVIDPITVRPFEGGKYEIIAGRHRTRAAALCGLPEIPGIIRDIDDVKAAMMMLDTNLEQRHNLSYSEKAYAYRMRMELEGRQGKRTDLEKNGERVDLLAEIGKKNKDGRRTVADLIRLTYLLPGLLKLVDDGKIGFKVGVQISHLSQATQICLLDTILPSGGKIKAKQAMDLRKLEEYGALGPETIQQVFSAKETVPASFTISGKVFQEYADILGDKKEAEKLFLAFLKDYRYQQHKKGA